MREFDTVGVVGLGAMGAGITEVFARAGFDVAAVDIDHTAVDTGRERIEGSLTKALSRGKLSEADADMIRGRVSYSADRASLAAADLVVEAVPERMDLKREVFADLDERCRPGTILATNTSSLSVTEIAALTSRPESVVGLHFFNPAPVMKLVEVVGTVATDPSVLNLAAEVAKRLGKTPVTVGDRAGFVANALLVPYINDAVLAFERGIASREDIDTAAAAEAGLPMGPLTLGDMVGLDVCLAVMDVLWQEFRSPRHVAAPLLRRMVAAGRLGRKTGQGFHAYAAEGVAAPTPTPGPLTGALDSAGLTLGELLLSAHLNDALSMVQEGYATAADVDTAMRLGCGYPRGPVELAREVGAARLGERLAAVDALAFHAGRPAPVD